jgi:hypothetical protein
LIGAVGLRPRARIIIGCYVGSMRTMQIRPFPGAKMLMTDPGSLIKQRLIHDLVIWPDQAVPRVGYMAWPNDPIMSERWLEAHRCDDPSAIEDLARRLVPIEQHWARVADIVHLHYDLTHGRHLERRGGASVGKAIALIDANARSKGTGAAKLWEIWTTYKDVAHVVTAAVLVSAEAKTRYHTVAPFLLQPYRMAMLMPELVISVAMTFESHGLQHVPYGRTQPMFHPESLSRIPADINLSPLPPPVRQITRTDLAVLRARRAGNRGKARTTPVSAENSKAVS